jgi:hypothetical protein
VAFTLNTASTAIVLWSTMFDATALPAASVIIRAALASALDSMISAADVLDVIVIAPATTCPVDARLTPGTPTRQSCSALSEVINGS